MKKTIVLERALAEATPAKDFLEFVKQPEIGNEGQKPVYIYLVGSTEQDVLLISTEPITEEERKKVWEGISQ
jgi:hypothetical protein